MKMPLDRRRLLVVCAALTAWALLVVVRMIHVQVVRHDEWVARAARQQERTVSLSPLRGSIRDRMGRVLADSVEARSVYADPTAVADPVAVAASLASIKELKLSKKQIESRLRGRSEFAWIARQLPDEVADRIERMELPGIYTLAESTRMYPKQDLAAPLLGFVSIDGDGLGGVELATEKWVRGEDTKITLLRDARRGMYQIGGDARPVDGQNVVLTIDQVIQYIAEDSLQRAVDRSAAKGGTAVVLDPRNGAVLAMASVPSFDANRFAAYSPEQWRNRAAHDLYEPGSTFKIVTAAAALEERLVTPSQMVDCERGYIEVAGRRIREHDNHQYGVMSFEDVLVNSSNVGTIKVGLALGPARLHEWIRRFGFGQTTGMELPGEARGIIRPVEKWSKLSNAILSIGQELAATPLQVARSAAVIANGGTLVPLHIIDRVENADGQIVWQHTPVEGERVVSERTAALLNEMLKSVVSRGTGSNAAVEGFPVAGKTGTAQKAGRGGYMPGRYVASFVGWLPADRPRLVILVTVDEPRGAYYGGAVAAPVFREIAEASMRYLGEEPSVPVRRVVVPPVRLATFSQQPRPGDSTAATGAPDLVGLDARTAAERAVAAGWDLRLMGEGLVVEQTPRAGETRTRRTLNVRLKSGTETRG